MLALQQKEPARPCSWATATEGWLRWRSLATARLSPRWLCTSRGVSIDRSMPADRMPTYEKKVAEGRNLDALVEYALAVAPRRMQSVPPWLLKALLRLDFMRHPEYRQMLDLLHQLARENGRRSPGLTTATKTLPRSRR